MDPEGILIVVLGTVSVILVSRFVIGLVSMAISKRSQVGEEVRDKLDEMTRKTSKKSKK